MSAFSADSSADEQLESVFPEVDANPALASHTIYLGALEAPSHSLVHVSGWSGTDVAAWGGKCWEQ